MSASSAKIQELLTEAQTAFEKAEEIRKAHPDGEEIPDEELSTIDAFLAEAQRKTEAAERERRVLDLGVSLNQPIHKSPLLVPVKSNGGSVESRIECGKERIEDCPWSSMGEQLIAVKDAVLTGRVDPRLAIKAVSGMSEGIPSDGGFLLATEFSNNLLKHVHETGSITSRCNLIPMATNTLEIPGVDETSRASGSRWGGVSGSWEGEGDTVAASKVKFRKIKLTAHKFKANAYVTDEMMQDSRALEAIVRQAFIEEISFQLEDAIINGNGVGKPLGVLNSSCLVTITKETGQDASSIVLPNILKMYSAMPSRSRAKAAWFVNTDCYPQIWGLKHEVGTGGVPVFLPPGSDATKAPNGRLLGLPVLDIEQAAALGTVGDVTLGDFSQYVLGQRGGIKADSSMHVRFLQDEMTFRFILRVDGQPAWNGSLAPYKGSTSRSPFVALATRA